MTVKDITTEILDACYNENMVTEVTPELEAECLAITTAIQGCKNIEASLQAGMTLVAMQMLSPDAFGESMIGLGLRLGFLLAKSDKSNDELERMFNL